MLKKANPNSLWAYIWESLLSGLFVYDICGAYFQEGLFLRELIIIIDYYQNFMVYKTDDRYVHVNPTEVRVNKTRPTRVIGKRTLQNGLVIMCKEQKHC